ncbi:hypothetical protein [Paenibacillus turpanensis]|uniref:hypothetical protein n=1 Tax=Paenibacillus turpanensis TaxID=2689078 RepID=UPI0014086625|nr:hypothetical protein [Paenibacillus turpanensis]
MQGQQEKAKTYIGIAADSIEHMMEQAKDRYGAKQTPLFADGFQVDTFEPVRWKSNGEVWTLSNLGNQQNWLRSLAGLSALTGDSKYKQRALEAVRYGLDQLRYGDLLYWGGHLAFDLEEKRPVHASDKGPQHELKCHYPFYDLMYEANPQHAVRYIEAFWDSHVRDWGNLEFNRHGQPREREAGYCVWDNVYGGEEVFFTAEGLTFINAGSDLYYAAAELYRLNGNEKALLWAKRMAQRYADTRHPETGMGGYQFSISVLPGRRGDRAIDQFAGQLEGHRVIEATLSVARQVHTITAEAALCRLELAEGLGEAGAEFLRWAVEDLLAYGRHSYDMADHCFHPVLTDGTRLTGLELLRDGYYGKQGEKLAAAKADFIQLWSYAKAYRLSREPELWQLVRSMAAGRGLGEIGEQPGGAPALTGSACGEPAAIFALLELYRATGGAAFLAAACEAADAMVAARLHKRVFLAQPDFAYAKLDAIEPLALLHLAAELAGRPGSVPVYSGGKAFFGAAHDGYGHEVDTQFVYRRLLGETV